MNQKVINDNHNNNSSSGSSENASNNNAKISESIESPEDSPVILRDPNTLTSGSASPMGSMRRRSAKLHQQFQLLEQQLNAGSSASPSSSASSTPKRRGSLQLTTSPFFINPNNNDDDTIPNNSPPPLPSSPPPSSGNSGPLMVPSLETDMRVKAEMKYNPELERIARKWIQGINT